MAKIGRNDPCPCGSGKKSKKCCLEKTKNNSLRRGAGKYREQLGAGKRWDLEEIRLMSTEEIISRLRGFGIHFTEEKFLEDVKKFHSACDLAEHWWKIYRINAKGFDEDFPWMAAIILWERLAPQVINTEKLDRMMQRGYGLLDEGKEVEACNLWLEIWEHLKKRFTPEMKSISEAERVFSGMQSLFNWCQDVEMALGNAGREDSTFYEKRIEYCREFYTFFPETDGLIIENMKRAEAESYFALGMIEQGEKSFQALIEEFPDSAWVYIGWGDMYYLFRPSEKVPLDYEKAESIYRLAVERNVDEMDVVLERLEEVEKAKSGGKV